MNLLRQQALENIEQLINEEDTSGLNDLLNPTTDNKISRRSTYLNDINGKIEKPTVFSFLRHNYILSKSVVVIVDENFSSFYFHNQAHQILSNLMNSLR